MRRESGSVRGTATPNRCAARARVQPCTSREASTTTKATLKYKPAFASFASSGIEARKMLTAPRRPTQPMKPISPAR